MAAVTELLLFPPVDAEQRWRPGGRSVWIRPGPTVDVDRHLVAPVGEAAGAALHAGPPLCGAMPASIHRIGLLDTRPAAAEGRTLVGVVVHSAPVPAALLRNVFPELREYASA